MRQISVVFTLLSIFFLSALATPLSLDHSLNKRNSGKGTWFTDGLGACGISNNNNDAIVALSTDMYGSGGQCGQWVSIKNTNNGNTACGLVRDKCQNCGSGDLDMSTGLFQKLGNVNEGVLPIEWKFMPAGCSP